MVIAHHLMCFFIIYFIYFNKVDTMKKIDKLILISVVIISLFGLLMIYSSSSIWAEYKFNDPYKFLKTQAIF